MYYRRKYLIALGQQFGDRLDNLRLQKLLFLATRRQDRKLFDFVPYKFGCFSFQANQDLNTMHKRAFVEKVEDSWDFSNSARYLCELKKEDRSSIAATVKEFSSFSNEDLIRFTYEYYPYYAINSKILEDVLDAKGSEKVLTQRRRLTTPAFFTIGYEGISLETYLNKLIVNGVSLLVDVRKNSLSMKYGFSKNQLKNSTEGIGIVYKHIPELGIDSSKRRQLRSFADYRLLFKKYNQEILDRNEIYLEELEALASRYNRIAITCFEKEVCMCHRGEIAKALSLRDNWNIPIKNI